MEKKQETIHIKQFLSDCLQRLTDLEKERSILNKQREKIRMKALALFGEDGEYYHAEIDIMDNVDKEIKELTDTIQALERHIMGVPIRADQVLDELGKNGSANFEEQVDEAVDHLFRSKRV